MTSSISSSMKNVADRSDACNPTSRDVDIPIRSPSEEQIREICTVEVLETDNRYFELATESADLSGARLVWSPGRTSIPLGCVILRVEEPESDEQALEWLARFEEAILNVNCRLARIYLQKPNAVLESALTRTGYERRPEVAFVGPATAPPAGTTVSLQLMTKEADLDKMAEIDAEDSYGPDGHTADNATWNEIIRQKWRTGELSLYFIKDQDEICGTVGAMHAEHILRLKNLVVRPSYRKQGVGRRATLALWKMAFDSGKRLAVFGVPGGGGYATYKSAGLHPTWPQDEWCKILTAETGT